MSIIKFIKEVKKKHAKIDILINNASIFYLKDVENVGNNFSLFQIHQLEKNDSNKDVIIYNIFKEKINFSSSLNGPSGTYNPLSIPLSNFDKIYNTLLINFIGTKKLTNLFLKEFYPTFNERRPRIIFLSSRLGCLYKVKDRENRELINNLHNLMELDLVLENYFIDMYRLNSKEDMKEDEKITIMKKWPQCPYSFSKLLINSYLRILSEKLKENSIDFLHNENQFQLNFNNPQSTFSFHPIITSCCPGFCDTDMTNHAGNKSPFEGSQTPFMLSILDEDTLFKYHGKFLGEFEANREFRILNW